MNRRSSQGLVIIDLEIPMIKYVALISLSVGLVMTRMVPSPLFPEPPAYSLFALDPVDMARKNRYLDEQFKARYAFADVREGILEQLAQGKISLIETCNRINRAAKDIYPRFNCLLCVDKKLDPKRKLAWNIVEQFRLDAEESSSMSGVVQRLEKELASSEFQAWCRKPW